MRAIHVEQDVSLTRHCLSDVKIYYRCIAAKYKISRKMDSVVVLDKWRLCVNHNLGGKGLEVSRLLD